MTELSAPRTAGPDVKGLRAPERTMELLRDLVATHAGMFYDETRLEFLKNRLAPLVVDRGFDSFLDYYYLLKYDATSSDEWLRAIDALSVQETYFWREFDQIKALVEVILPTLLERRATPLRIVSIPCATGEEPLSIAMALDDAGWFTRAVIDIRAADASEAALRRARTGRYSGRAFRQLPDALRLKYFRQAAEHGSEWAVKAEIHRRVSAWTRTNIIDRAELLSLGPCDVIFCRNLFIYFTPQTVTQVVDTFAEMLPSPGFLCVGAAESLLRTTSRFELREIRGAYVYVKP
jgi:chemotaxis protein methyltransferase CheR